MPELNRQALDEVPRGATDGIERLDQLERGSNLLRRKATHLLKLFDARLEVAVLVQVADDGATDLLRAFGGGAHVELPDQMRRQVLFLGERVLERRQRLAGLDRGAGNVGALD